MTRALQVNNRIITSTEIIPLLAGYQLLPSLLKEVLIDEAIERFPYSLEERENSYQQFYEKNQLHNETERQAWLNYHGIIPEQLEALAVRELRIQKFKQATWGPKLESYFLAHKQKLDKVIYSLLRTTDLEIAQELYYRIRKDSG